MQNRTADGFELDNSYQLRFTPITFEYQKSSDWLQVAAYVEHNESLGKRRPYAVIHIGKFAFQSGWLFDTEVSGDGD